MTFTLITLYPRNNLVYYGWLSYAIFEFIGVSMTIHWFSDCLAGMIIGSIVGIVVGKWPPKREHTTLVCVKRSTPLHTGYVHINTLQEALTVTKHICLL
jgi:hypothetical protein